MSQTAEQSGYITAPRSSGGIDELSAQPMGVKTYTLYTNAPMFRRSTNYQKFQAYKSYLNTMRDRGNMSDDQRIAILANLPEGQSDIGDPKGSYDTWINEFSFPDTEQTRQHFSGLIGNDSWMVGMTASIDSAIGAVAMASGREDRQKNRKRNKFGF